MALGSPFSMAVQRVNAIPFACLRCFAYKIGEMGEASFRFLLGLRRRILGVYGQGCQAKI